MAPTPWDTCPRSLILNVGTESRNSKQESDQTVLATMKALTKTTNCAFTAKKWKGHECEHELGIEAE